MRSRQTLIILITIIVVGLAVGSTKAVSDALISRDRRSNNTAHLSAVPPAQQSRSLYQLSLQPEADRLRRRLGQRFLTAGREMSVMVGAVTLGAERHDVRIVRTRDSDTERMAVFLDGGIAELTWNAVDGALTGGTPLAGRLRTLVERLALDSPDQFVLAQTRGASYYTVARGVRPEEVGGADNYDGPLWDLVRVSEPEGLTQNKPQSLSRLYYINTRTGLIDKIVAQEGEQVLAAEISGWSNQGGESVPAGIKWKRNGETIMELSVREITHGPR